MSNCTHPDHNENETCEDRAVGCAPDCRCCLGDFESCCRCDKPGLENHSCPFKQNMSDDFDTMCNCCNDCTYECAIDV